MEFKTCSKCKKEKQLSDYSNMKDKKDGKDSYCKRCRSEANKKYKKTNKEKIRKYTREYRRKTRNTKPENFVIKDDLELTKTFYNLTEFKKEKGYIYLMKEKEYTKRIKIGKAQNIESRISAIKGSYAWPDAVELVYFAQSKNVNRRERELHMLFESKKVHGEWYELNEMDIDYIKNLLKKDEDYDFNSDTRFLHIEKALETRAVVFKYLGEKYIYRDCLSLEEARYVRNYIFYSLWLYGDNEELRKKISFPCVVPKVKIKEFKRNDELNNFIRVVHKNTNLANASL